MEIKLKLTPEEHKELVSYCNLNDLLISSVVKDSFTTGFNIERYGLLNAGPEVKEKVVEKEVIKRVEVPVEIEKEVIKIEYIEVEKPVEIIKEVPVEKIVEVIKEVPVEKVVEVVKEIIKEVPVEKIVVKEVISEVPVEKIVYVTDQEEMKSKLFQKEQEFEQQRKEFSTKTQEIENIFQKEKKELLLKIQQLESKEPEIREVVKEVEVIKEIVIEKEVGGGVDKSKFDALQQTVLKLRQETLEKDKIISEYEKTISDIQKFQDKQAMYLKGSNLDDKLYK